GVQTCALPISAGDPGPGIPVFRVGNFQWPVHAVGHWGDAAVPQGQVRWQQESVPRYVCDATGRRGDQAMKNVCRILFASALLALAAVAVSAPGHVTEASMLLTGTIDIEADGSVSGYSIDYDDKVPDYVLANIAG